MKKGIIVFMLSLLTITTLVLPQTMNVEGASIKLNATSLTLKNVRSYTLKVKNTSKKVTWTSSNKKVATVSSKGVVKAVKNGTCYIYAKVSGKKLKCKVTVKTPTIYASSIQLNKTSLSLNWGSTYTLKANISPSHASNKTIKWTSSQSDIVSVTSTGKITAKNPGIAIITATTSNNKKATCKVTVNNQYYIKQKIFENLKAKENANKIIIVSTKNTSTHYCVVQYFKKENEQWKEIFKVNGSVGKYGIDKVKEGDKKTPTGLFHFTQIMGIAKNPGQTLLPYHQIDKNDYWCGEKYYNQFVDEDVQSHKCTKKNDEKLINYTQPYQYLAVFDYNSKHIKGKGSGIFLHCTTKSGYTAGCIAIEKEKMKYLLKEIDLDTIIIIDQSKNMYKY